MREYNFYIEDYFINHFRNMKADRIPRDFELEKKIIDAGKSEFYLQTSEENLNKTIFHYKTKTVLEKFKLENILYRKLYYPLLDLYIGINKNESYEIYKEEEIVINYDNLKTCFISESIKSLENFYNDHYYYIDNDCCNSSIISLYLENQKILIPFFWGDDRTIPYSTFSFFPFENAFTPFFNEFFLKNYSKAIVIITDSIELASINQQVLNKSGIKDIVWISFYGEEKYLNSLNWDLFRDRKIYYLLKEHSGFGTETVFNIADAVYEKLEKIDIYEMQYISLLDNFSLNKKQSVYQFLAPVILSREELMSRRSKAFSYEYSPISFLEFRNNLSKLYSKLNPLLKPLIYEKTTTLIHGSANAPKALFALNIAFAMSQGLNPFQDWTTNNKKTPALYLKGESNCITLDSHLEDTLKIYAYRKKINVEKIDLTVADINDTPKPFPGESFNNNFIKDNFYWNLFDITEDKIQNSYNAIIKFIKSQVGEFEDLFLLCHKVLVLDDLFIENKIYFKRLGMLFLELHRKNWTIITVNNSKDLLSKELKLDNIIKISERNENSNKISFSVSIEKSYKKLESKDKKFICTVDTDSSTPNFTKVYDYRKVWPKNLLIPRKNLYKKVKHKQLIENKTIREIAYELEISESMVKKISSDLKKGIHE